WRSSSVFGGTSYLPVEGPLTHTGCQGFTPLPAVGLVAPTRPEARCRVVKERYSTGPGSSVPAVVFAADHPRQQGLDAWLGHLRAGIDRFEFFNSDGQALVDGILPLVDALLGGQARCQAAQDLFILSEALVRRVVGHRLALPSCSALMARAILSASLSCHR